MEFLNLFFDWSKLLSLGADVVTYFFLATVGTFLFLIRLAMGLFGGADHGDLDMDVTVDSDVSFAFFSLLSILAFFMGAGWMGLACRIDWQLGRLASAFFSGGFGVAMMSAASTGMYFTRRLNLNIPYDAKSALGKVGRVYLTLPLKGEGHGQVEISVSGRKKIMTAISHGPQIPAFTDVEVLEVREDDILVVKPLT